jgi:hypothetical protein
VQDNGGERQGGGLRVIAASRPLHDRVTVNEEHSLRPINGDLHAGLALADLPDLRAQRIRCAPEVTSSGRIDNPGCLG